MKTIACKKCHKSGTPSGLVADTTHGSNFVTELGKQLHPDSGSFVFRLDDTIFKLVSRAEAQNLKELYNRCTLSCIVRVLGLHCVPISNKEIEIYDAKHKKALFDNKNLQFEAIKKKDSEMADTIQKRLSSLEAEHGFFMSQEVLIYAEMPFEGEDLFSFCEKVFAGHEEPLDVIVFFKAIMNAIQALLRDGIIPVDLKPENMILRRMEEAALGVTLIDTDVFVVVPSNLGKIEIKAGECQSKPYVIQFPQDCYLDWESYPPTPYTPGFKTAEIQKVLGVDRQLRRVRLWSYYVKSLCDIAIELAANTAVFASELNKDSPAYPREWDNDTRTLRVLELRDIGAQMLGNIPPEDNEEYLGGSTSGGSEERFGTPKKTRRIRENESSPGQTRAVKFRGLNSPGVA